MAFKDFLFGFFPHRWLNPNNQNNKRLFGRLGAIFDYVEELVNAVKKESNISTAVHSIPLRELENGISSDSSLSLDIRRSNIIATKRKTDGPITKEELISAINAYDIDASITNNHSNHEMIISIYPNKHYIDKETFSEMSKFVEHATRAHIGKKYLLLNSSTENKYFGGIVTQRKKITLSTK